jgi:hypothetical protein
MEAASCKSLCDGRPARHCGDRICSLLACRNALTHPRKPPDKLSCCKSWFAPQKIHTRCLSVRGAQCIASSDPSRNILAIAVASVHALIFSNAD